MTESSVDTREERAGIGGYLRSCREARGISLDDAAQVTRIAKSYLDALEREDFDRLPNSAYCKGFIRIYAGYLGVSGDDAVARYERATAPPITQTASPSRRKVAKADLGRARGDRRRWLFPLGLLAVVVVLAFFFYDDQDQPVRPVPQQLSLPAPPQSPVQPAWSSAVQTPSVPPTVLPAAATVPPAAAPLPTPQTGDIPRGGVILKLKVNQDSWVNIDIDGRLSQPYDLKAGDLIEWKAEKVITLDIGNAGGVEAELNGKPLAPLGPPGRNIHIVLHPEGVVANP
ncbi:MAG: DUF4115 domain-containing protein [Geobacter sp.]|nr:DUF4115 domain-containing protein [Geobacter sp.]